MLIFRLIVFFIVGVSTVTGWARTYPPELQSCEKITVPLCAGNGTKYGKTRLPNFLDPGHTDQNQVGLFTQQKELRDLVQTRCSKDLVFFLCATLLPICVEGKQFRTPPMVPPCRKLCKKVYKDCLSSMKRLNFQWPVNLNCSRLPNHATGMCIKPSSFGPPRLPRASCKWKKRPVLRSKNLNKYNYIFRGRLVSSGGGRTRIRLSIQRIFGQSSKIKDRKIVTIRNCKGLSRNISRNKTMFLVLAKKVKGGLEISEIAEWKISYSRILRGYIKNHKRRGKSG